MAQPDHEDVLARFHNWARTALVAGRSGPDAPGHHFIPSNRLKFYFKNQNCAKLNAILSTLFPASSRDPGPSAQDILQEGYMLVFAILLSIKADKYIQQFVAYEGLNDHHLPFTAKPADWPSSPDNDELFDKFREKQWMFLPAKMGRSRSSWEKERILPITGWKEHVTGASSNTVTINIHRDYVLPDMLDPSASAQQDPIFELKTYKGFHGELQYYNEVRAFEHLKKGCNFPDAPSSLIKCYGSYKHNDTYNILLEHADGGTLQDLFDDHEQRPQTAEIHAFWERILQLGEALQAIHYVKQENPGEEPECKSRVMGFHQDVKPDNILIKRRPGMPLYLGDYKLADLGLAHFREFTGETCSDKARVGTETYGAPETYRANWLATAQPRRVEPSIDVWSLGAVLSEAAVWVRQGPAGLEQYRQARRKETRNLTLYHENESFHDKAKALRCIKDRHECIKKDAANGDIIERTTPLVIDLVEKNMLVESPWRSSARDVCAAWAGLNSKLRNQMSSMSHSGSTKKKDTTRTPTLAHSPSPRQSAHFHSSPTSGFEQQRRSPESPLNRMPYTAEPGRISDYQLPETASTVPSPSASRKRPNAKSPPEIPTLSVQNAKDWIQDFESRNVLADSLDQACCIELKKRDHYIVIDDAGSMRQHWTEVVDITCILGQILLASGADDRIDIAMVVHDDKSLARRKSQMEDFVRRHKPPETQAGQRVSPLSLKLKHIIDAYKRKIKGGTLRRAWTKITHQPGHQPLTIYILTDGLYQDDTRIETTLRSLMTDLRDEFADDDKFVGIQFIRFGASKHGIDKLEALDKLSSNDRSIAWDIVDHEPANGNVWKMLLGSINEFFDGDADVKSPQSEFSHVSAADPTSPMQKHRRTDTGASGYSLPWRGYQNGPSQTRLDELD